MSKLHPGFYVARGRTSRNKSFCYLKKLYMLGLIFNVLWASGQVVELGRRQRPTCHFSTS